jgi:rubrerythrin
MLQANTTAELFEIAIRLERATESFYTGLAQMFAHEPEIAKFWKTYAEEEAGHARFLEDLRGKLTAEQLERPVDAALMEIAHRQAQNLPDQCLAEITNLDEAYQKTVEAENSETNTIFEFLAADFSLTNPSGKFLRHQLHSHVEKLTNSFPSPYQSRLKRLEVKALPLNPDVKQNS